MFQKLGRTIGLGLLLAAFGSLTLTVGCASRAGSVAGKTNDRESESEYDLARDSWLRRGDARDGLTHALRSIEIDDDNADAHHLAALIYLDLCQKLPQDCRLADSESHARRAVKLRDDYREAKNTLAVVLIHQKKFNEAISVLQPLTQDILYTTPESAWGNLGWAYFEIGRLDDAEQALQRSVAAQARFCVGYYRLGLVQERKGLPEAAIESFTHALQADSRCAGLQDALLHRAKSYLSKGKTEPGKSDLSRCVELSLETLAGKECEVVLQKLK
jgi:type IV pilus assembly protein PilF